DFRQFIGPKETLKQQDALTMTGIAQAHRVVEFQQPKTVRIRQRARHTQQAVPVCVGLDDSQRCRTAGMPACNGEIVFQGRKVETSLNRAGHVRSVFPMLQNSRSHATRYSMRSGTKSGRPIIHAWAISGRLMWYKAAGPRCNDR